MILKPFELLYHVLSGAKNILYDLQWIEAKKMPVPVISVGNLSFGGTGKTPFIEFICEELQSSKKIAIVCRSYKAALSQPQKVDLTRSDAAAVYGDEACLLQKNLPRCQVWSGPQKFKTAEACLVEKPEFILIDDGFSHRRLQRNFDLVLFDATKLNSDYYRESNISLKRAQAVILMKTNGVSKAEIEKFRNQISMQFSHLKNSIYESEMQSDLQLPKQTKVFAFCGIAKPESFLNSLKKLGYDVVAFERYADHQAYSVIEQSKILSRYHALLVQNPELQLVTTEKDAIKIQLKELASILKTGQYKVQMNQNDKERLFEKIRSIL